MVVTVPFPFSCSLVPLSPEVLCPLQLLSVLSGSPRLYTVQVTDAGNTTAEERGDKEEVSGEVGPSKHQASLIPKKCIS